MELSNKQLKEMEKILNRIISNLLWGPCGDPAWENCRGAADAFILLKKLELKISAENEVRSFLEKDNICGENFLKKYDERREKEN